jgi:hypothetical protein
MLNPRTYKRAMRTAASVLRGTRRHAATAFAGLAILVSGAGCGDDSGASGFSDTAGAADTAGDIGTIDPNDILGDLQDLVFGDDGDEPDGGDPEDAEESAETSELADSAPGPDTDPGDTAEPTDTTAGPDTQLADASDPSDALDTAQPDSAQPDVLADADAGHTDLGCLQHVKPEIADCVESADCSAEEWLVCLDGKCYAQDFTPNQAAQDCCTEQYAQGNFGVPGCNPWGPPAPPAMALELLELIDLELA